MAKDYTTIHKEINDILQDNRGIRASEHKQIEHDILDFSNNLDSIKENKTTVTALSNKVTALETQLANLIIPKIIIDSGSQRINSPAGGQLYDTWTNNYIDVYPPSGYTINNLSGFSASIKTIFFAGGVNKDDSLWCKWQKYPTTNSDRVRVICSNSEIRAAGEVNYMAVWIKY